VTLKRSPSAWPISAASMPGAHWPLPSCSDDVHLRLEGAVVNWLQTVFLEDWAYALEKDPKNEPADIDLLLPDAPEGPLPVQVITSGPDNGLQAIYRAHLAAINAAEERVWLTTPYFVPTEAALAALTNASLRGVDVQLLVPRRSDSALVTAAARSYYDELIRCGVRVYEYKARMLHSKTLVVDDSISIIGTANFDYRSFFLNYEVCAIAYGPQLNGDLARQFELDLEQAQRVHFKRDLGFALRLFDSGARLCSPLL
jgi:cardiolipin synthase